jgi:chromosomal replication initiation ATPase DnaA
MRSVVYISPSGEVSETPVTGWYQYKLIKKIVNISELFTEICNLNGFSVDDVAQNCHIREREYVECRYWHWLFMREFENKSFSECGKVFKKDHATALYGINKLKQWANGDSIFRRKYADIISASLEIKPNIFDEVENKKAKL